MTAKLLTLEFELIETIQKSLPKKCGNKKQRTIEAIETATNWISLFTDNVLTHRSTQPYNQTIDLEHELTWELLDIYSTAYNKPVKEESTIDMVLDFMRAYEAAYFHYIENKTNNQGLK